MGHLQTKLNKGHFVPRELPVQCQPLKMMKAKVINGTRKMDISCSLGVKLYKIKERVNCTLQSMSTVFNGFIWIKQAQKQKRKSNFKHSLITTPLNQ